MNPQVGGIPVEKTPLPSVNGVRARCLSACQNVLERV